MEEYITQPARVQTVHGAPSEEAQVPTGFDLSSNALKLIAIIAMTIDHIAGCFLDSSTLLAIAMHFVGRITGPIMFFMVAEGYRRTRNANHYALRLFVFAAVSYLPFVYTRTGQLPNADSWMDFNVIYTILMALLAIRVRHEWKNPGLQLLAILGLCYLSFFGDWGTLGFLVMLSFDYFHGDFHKQAITYCVLVLFVGGVWRVLNYPLYYIVYGMQIDGSILLPSLSDFGMFLPIMLLAFYNGKKGKGGTIAKWGFYAYYPLHLLILSVIKYTVLKLG